MRAGFPHQKGAAIFAADYRANGAVNAARYHINHNPNRNRGFSYQPHGFENGFRLPFFVHSMRSKTVSNASHTSTKKTDDRNQKLTRLILDAISPDASRCLGDTGSEEIAMSDNHGSAPRAGAVVARDAERFKLLYRNGRPVIPAGYTAPLEIKATRATIGERTRAQSTGA